MNTYTYTFVVDFDEDNKCQSLGAETKVLGGKLTTVCLGDLTAENERLESTIINQANEKEELLWVIERIATQFKDSSNPAITLAEETLQKFNY